MLHLIQLPPSAKQKKKYKKDAQTNKKNKKKRTQAIKKRNKTGWLGALKTPETP